MVSSSTIKFLCSYGGKIVPRPPDAKLRYHGGQTRVIAVYRSISFTELSFKLGEFMMSETSSEPVCVRCQLPTENLDDALVSITSDEDLSNLIEEYDRVSSSLKIRVFLSLPKRLISPSSSSSSTPRFTGPTCLRPAATAGISVNPYQYQYQHNHGCNYVHGDTRNNNLYLIHNGYHWQ